MRSLTDTPATSPRRPSRRLLAITATVVGVLLLTGCLDANGQRSLDLINIERRAHGMHEVVNDLDLNATAQAWAEQMQANGRISHSRLVIPPGSTRVTENVGVGASVDSLHINLMNSPSHKANILDTRVTRVGIGVSVDANGRVWLVQLYAN